MQVYYGRFGCAEDVYQEFGIKSQNIEIIYAHYEYANYEGKALVIFIQNGLLYEVNESHCSCHGLENWSPEETTALALLARPNVPTEAKNNIKEYYGNLISFL